MVSIGSIHFIAGKLPHSVWHLSLLAPCTSRMVSRSVLEHPRTLGIRDGLEMTLFAMSYEEQPFQKMTFAILEVLRDEGEKDLL